MSKIPNYSEWVLNETSARTDDIVIPEKMGHELADIAIKLIGCDPKWLHYYPEAYKPYFKVPFYSVSTQPKNNTPFFLHFSAGPFPTRKQAEEHLKMLKETGLGFLDTNSLQVEEKVDYRAETLTPGQMLRYVEALDPKFSVEDFLHKRRGSIAANKFKPKK
jgi:hypothetical protein